MYALFRLRLSTAVVLLLMVVMGLLKVPTTNADESFCNSISDVTLGECVDLVRLYEATDGADWTNKTNWLVNIEVCSWYGVICDGNQRVVKIELNSNNLIGEIPTSIGAGLPYVTDLVLYDNDLSGVIPDSLGNFSSLEILDLSENSFTGIEPLYDACDTLQQLFLGVNPFSGSFPSWINEECVNLRWLGMCNMGLTGDFPDLSGLNSLISVFVCQNNFTLGNVPAWLVSHSQLQFIGISSTNRTGTIPVFASPDLGYLELEGNHFTGNLPSQYNATTYPHLYHLNLTDLQIENFDSSFATLQSNFLNGGALYIDYNKIDEFYLPIPVKTMFLTLWNGDTSWMASQYLPPFIVPTAINSSSIRIDLEHVPVGLDFPYRPNDLYEILQSPNPIGGPYTRVTTISPFGSLGNHPFYLMYNSFTLGQTYYYSARIINNASSRPQIKASEYRYNEGVEMVEFSPVDCSDSGTTGIDPSDCEALLSIYESTGGDNWQENSKAGWGEAANICLGGWQNVYCEDGRVTYLFMGGIGMTGDFPHVVTQLTGLIGFFFDRNQLTGTLPDFTGMPALYYAIASLNYLTGGLPEFPPSVGYINFSHNQLTGQVPQSYGTQNFDGIVLNGNMLFGDLPAGLGTNPSFGVSGAFGHVNLSYNALTVSDAGTIAALNAKNPTFFTTQTLPPTQIAVSALPNDAVSVSWTLPTYTGDSGFYEVGMSQSGGPYIFMPATRTPNKLTTSTTVAGLSPNVQYCFVVATGTIPHGVRPPDNDYMTDTSTHNYNTVFSRASEQSACITLPESSEPPTQPQTISPQPLAILTGTRAPELSWNSNAASEQVTFYRLRVRNDATGEMVINRKFVPDTICVDGICRVELEGLSRTVNLPNGRYNWQVSVINAYGKVHTPKQVFTLTKPSAASLSAPIDNILIATSTPTLEFSIPDGQAITTVRVVVSKVGAAKPRVDRTYPVEEICVGTICSVTLPKPLKNGRYEWRVQVKNANGKRQSTIGRFKVSL